MSYLRLPQASVWTGFLSRSLSELLCHTVYFCMQEHSHSQQKRDGNSSSEQRAPLKKGLGAICIFRDLDALQGEAGSYFKRRLQPTLVPKGWLMQLFPCKAAFFIVLILIKKKERIWSSYFDPVPRIIWKFFFLEWDFLFQISPWWGERVSWAELE